MQQNIKNTEFKTKNNIIQIVKLLDLCNTVFYENNFIRTMRLKGQK